jgi:drug/metabolite transporter (DMT)-like permease
LIDEASKDAPPVHDGSSRAAGVASIITAAVLFGLSAPLVKIILGSVGPFYLTGLLYLGSGIGLLIIELARNLSRRLKGQKGSEEAPLSGKDYLYLAGACVCGGMLGPILLTLGLVKIPASTASLFLNVECIFTALIAALVFKEPLDSKVWWALGFMFAGGVVLSIETGSAGVRVSWSVLLVVGACLMWAIDNNLTRPLSDKDPFVIARTKGLVAGIVFIFIAGSLIGEERPALIPLSGTMLTGAFCYGISLILFIYALRYLGAARTGVYFGTAPFIGAIFSILLLSEPVTGKFAASFLLMAAGMLLLTQENHSHLHAHKAISHEHRHSHDSHHLHSHLPEEEGAKVHSHFHAHEELSHQHPHMPDSHHRHTH